MPKVLHSRKGLAVMKWFFAVFLVAASGAAVFGQQNHYAGHGYVHYGLAGVRRNFKTAHTVGVGGGLRH